MADGADIVELGREAWQRLQQRERATFDDWICVGQACAIGRAVALKAANTNRPFGRIYQRAMADWLAANGIGICSAERYWSLALADNAAAIRKWRDGLDDATRRRLNHPQAVWMNWRKSQGAKKPAARRDYIKSDRPKHDMPNRTGGHAAQVRWPQDMLKRTAIAMRESRSADWFVLARVALEAAIRNQDDLVALLAASEPKPKTVKPLSAAIMAPAEAVAAM